MPDFARRIIGGLIGVAAAFALMYLLGLLGVFPIAVFAAIGIGMGMGGTYRSIPWTVGAVAASAAGSLLHGWQAWIVPQGNAGGFVDFLKVIHQMPGMWLLGLILTVVLAALYGGGSGPRRADPNRTPGG
ncbi:MAG: hypothetical protein AB8G96_13925 [Phycisphaerales bacterium]